MTDTSAKTKAGSTQRDSRVGILIGPVFLVIAAWFLFGSSSPTLPSREVVSINAEDITTDPLRQMMPDPPTIQVAGYAKKCTECHSLFTSAAETPHRLNQHRNIVQAHGMNDRCFNCHDRTDRGRLTLPGSKTVSFDDVALLCATCHGTTYRDWQDGMHGRTNGYWSAEHGTPIRLNCTQCHDPHAPAFGKMSALPGPSTLRMGDPNEHPHEPGGDHNPLRQWSGGAAERGHE